MRFSPAMLVCLLTSMQATSESLDFAIYRLTGDTRALIADGTGDYEVSDNCQPPVKVRTRVFACR